MAYTGRLPNSSPFVGCTWIPPVRVTRNPPVTVTAARFVTVLVACSGPPIAYRLPSAYTTPIEIVTDSDLIAPHADITVFIVRAGLLERSMLPQVDKYYQAKRYNGMAILLNGTDGKGGYGYHKYGYHKYGYHYYGNADSHK